MPTLDPTLSVLAILFVGWLGTLAAAATRLPRIVPVILLGVALAPALHKSVLSACTDAGAAATTGAGSGAVSAASELRTFALLVALARGGLTMQLGNISRLRAPALLLCFVPYFAEVLVQVAVSRAALPDSSGLSAAAGTLPLSLLAASVWAPLSPSIVIPNMLHFIESGLPSTAGLVMTGAPIEVATALITFSAVEGYVKNVQAGGDLGAGPIVGWVVVQLVGSLAYGALFAGLFWAFVVHVRPHPAVQRLLAGSTTPPAQESLLVFLALFCLAYASCADYLVPRLVGLLAALAMALGTQLLQPALAAQLAAQLKYVWLYAEAFLFVLTGVVVRAAIDTNSPALGGGFLAVLACGSLVRLAADLLVALAWQRAVARAGRAETPRESAIVVLRRAAFLWSATTPKATLQASLGPRPATEAAALGITALTGAFIAQSCAVAILYMALVGSLLTYSVGLATGKLLEAYDTEAEAATSAGTETELKEGLLNADGNAGAVAVVSSEAPPPAPAL
jgi:hypothetical protein